MGGNLQTWATRPVRPSKPFNSMVSFDHTLKLAERSIAFTEVSATMKHLDKAANIAIIIGVAVFVFVALRGGFFTASKPSGTLTASLVGKSISLPGEIFPKKRDTLVMAMSTNCHYCAQSLPFYKSLTKAMQGRADTIAVFPQSATDGRAYLEAASIPTTKVISADLQTLGVRGTPTLLLLDSAGKVISEWYGLLNPDAQRGILSQAAALRTAPTGT